MIPFMSRHPEVAARETRALLIVEHEEIPPGEYAFVEWYCNEKGCDCRRVMLQVREKDSASRVLASINYGWETPEYYLKWTYTRRLAEEAAGAWLDPINPQTRYAPAFLEMFKEMVLTDEYIDRLKRHYELFKSGREWTRSSNPNRPKLGVKRQRKNPR
jgi:hypothetical protein